VGGEGDYSCYRQWRGEGETYAEEVRRVLLKKAFMMVCKASKSESPKVAHSSAIGERVHQPWQWGEHIMQKHVCGGRNGAGISYKNIYIAVLTLPDE